MLWVYADAKPDGSFTRVGGGAYDAATNTYGQGAYDADDIARAAVVYLRHWRATGDRTGERRRPTSSCAGWPTCRRSPARRPARSCCGCSPTAR